jgi:hypothetical protein
MNKRLLWFTLLFFIEIVFYMISITVGVEYSCSFYNFYYYQIHFFFTTPFIFDISFLFLNFAIISYLTIKLKWRLFVILFSAVFIFHWIQITFIDFDKNINFSVNPCYIN